MFLAVMSKFDTDFCIQSFYVPSLPIRRVYLYFFLKFEIFLNLCICVSVYVSMHTYLGALADHKRVLETLKFESLVVVNCPT